jgi:small-conductance mechanosensitive channel
MTAVGFQIATIRLDFISDTFENILETTYFILYLLVGIAVAWRSIDFSMAWYIKKHPPHDDNKAAEELQPLVQRTSHIILAAIGLILLLEHFGVSITALMATLGLTGFAISLALKDTISNLISGLVIMVDRPFNLGERIYISDIDAWADVIEIGIRTTKVVTRDNRLVILPNSNIVDNNVINYSQPDTTYRLQTDIGVGYGMDIPTIHRIFTDTVRNVEGVLPDKSVDVLFTEFGPSSMTIRVRWWVASYTEKRKSSHRVNSAIQEAAEKNDINMPNPTMDNNLKISIDEANGVSKTLKELN